MTKVNGIERGQGSDRANGRSGKDDTQKKKSATYSRAMVDNIVGAAKARGEELVDAAKNVAMSRGAIAEQASHLVQKVKLATSNVVETVASNVAEVTREAKKTALSRVASSSANQRAMNPHYAVRKKFYSYDDLIACGNGTLFGAGNPQLPLPNMLMFDRITRVNEDGGFGMGEIVAELDIKPSLWFFDCHFKGDPVMPGCLGLDALWQLLGFYLGWMGGVGKGRALGLGQLKFTGEVLPTARLVTYSINIKRLVLNRLIMGVADGQLAVDGKVVYDATDLKVGLFTAKK